MRRINRVVVWSVGAVTLRATVAGADPRVAVLDECAPVTFNATPPVGPGLSTICDVNFDGEVTFAEFVALLPPGHPAWRNDPSWLVMKAGRKVKVTNKGGEDHIFTEMAKFGGLRTRAQRALRVDPVPDCAGGPSNSAVASTFLEPVASIQGEGLGTERPSSVDASSY